MGRPRRDGVAPRLPHVQPAGPLRRGIQDRRHGRRVARGGGRPDRPGAQRCRPARGYAAGGRRGDGAPALPAARGRPRPPAPCGSTAIGSASPAGSTWTDPTSCWSRTGSTSCARPPVATCRSTRRRWPASRRRAGSRRTPRRSRARARSRPARRSRSGPDPGAAASRSWRGGGPLVTPGEGPVTPALVEEATAGLTATARRSGSSAAPSTSPCRRQRLAPARGRILRGRRGGAALHQGRLRRRGGDRGRAGAAPRPGPRAARHRRPRDTAGGFSFSDVPVDPLASARYLVSFSGGLYDPVHVGQLDAGGLGTPGVSGTPTVHGGLGEIAHNIYYPPGTSPEEERDDRLRNASSSAAWSGRAR